MTKRSKDSTLIQIVHPICCGLDVHKDKKSLLMTMAKNNMKSRNFHHLPKNYRK